MKSEGRPNIEIRKGREFRLFTHTFRRRDSDLFRISDFGLRT
jgi:hypothetical protein